MIRISDIRLPPGYTDEDVKNCEKYIESRIELVQLPEPDKTFLRERLLTMYANPVFNKDLAMKG